MKRLGAVVLIAVFQLTVGASCGGGGGGVTPVLPHPPTRDTAVYVYIAQSGGISVTAAPGSARAGSAVTVTTGAQQFITKAKTDGSLRYELPLDTVPPVQVTLTLPGGEVKSITAAIFDAGSHLQPSYFTTGQAPNDMVLSQGRFYIANSMDNNVQIRSAATLEVVATLTLPEYASPSYLFITDGIGFVTCNGNNTLVAFDPAIGSESWTLQLPGEGLSFLGPGKPWANAAHVFVPVANLEAFGDPSSYRPAEVFVVSIATREIVKRIALAGEDALEVAPLGNGELVVVETGNLSFDENWRPYATTLSYLEVIDEESLEVVRTVELGVIGASNPLVDAARNRIYVGSLLNGNLYVLNTANWTVERGKDNPVVVGAETSYLADLTLIEGAIVAASFNEDLLSAVSAEDYSVGAWPLPESLDVGESTEGFLAGPQTLAWNTLTKELFFMQGLANRVGRFELPRSE